MNPASLSPLPDGLTMPLARQWLEACHKILGAFPGKDWQGLVEITRPFEVGASLDERFINWVDGNELREGEPRSGWSVSLKGVSFMLSTDNPRLKPDEAWQHTGALLAKVAWINRAPVELAPFQVADVLLFGSMTHPSATDHGDMDVMLVLQPKQEGGSSAHEAFLRQHGLADENGFYSSRSKLEKFLNADPFVSASSSGSTVEVLVDQDPGFAAFSLLGRSWTERELAHTTLDEEAYAVVKALENGDNHPGRKAHVKRQLNRLPAFSAHTLPALAGAGMVDNLALDESQRVVWASMGPVPAITDQLRQRAQAAFQGSSHPLASALQEAWKAAPSLPSSSPGLRP